MNAVLIDFVYPRIINRVPGCDEAAMNTGQRMVLTHLEESADRVFGG